MSAEKKQLVFAILKFFEDELASSELDPDGKETIEVASQCLENAYKVNTSDEEHKHKYTLPASLLEIFNAGLTLKKTNASQQRDITPEQKEQAEKFKSEGNQHMKNNLFTEAVECYTKAIDVDPTNAVYFCNRAAAYSKVGDFFKSLEDCDKALEIDPNYSKAYGRKGLAHSALCQHQEAIHAFEKAVELDPTNESFKKNLEVSEQKLAEESASGMAGGMPGGFPGMPGGFPGMPAGFPGMGGMGGMPDFANFLNNPAIMNMASQMMANPQMQELMGQMLSGFQGNAEPGSETGDMAGFLQAGQRMAQQMQQQNPDLINRLREHHQAGGSQPDQDGSEEPKTNGDGASS